MQTYILLDLMYRTPTASFMLVLFMSISASLLVNHILKTGFYTTVISIPALLIAGLFGNAVLMLNHVTLSPDKASNAAMSASFGFIMIASISFIMFRVWARLRDKR